MLRKYLKYGIIVFISSIFGFFTSSYEYFKFVSEINLVDFANLVITSLIGLFIAVTIQKHQANERIEKDLLISEISQIKNDLKTIYTTVLNENIDFSDTVFTFKISSSNLSNLEDLFNICQINDCQNNILSLLNKVNLLKRIVTNSPVQNNKFIITDDDKNLFFVEYKKLTELFLELIVKINRK